MVEDHEGCKSTDLFSDASINKSLPLCSSPGKAQKSHIDEMLELYKFNQGPMYKSFYQRNLRKYI
jgi:hypothetical protein